MIQPLSAKVSEVLDIVWLNDNGKSGGLDIHPFHAHGGHYWDLGSGNGTYNAADNEEEFQTGYVPVKRDTTMLYRYAASGVNIYDRWMEGLEDQASEPRDVGDALSHSCAYDHEFVERLFFKFLGNHCRRCNCRDANGVDVWRCSGHCRTSARAIPFWIYVWNQTRFPTVTHYHS